LLARAFGLSLSFETPPPGAWEARPAAEPTLSLREAGREEIEDEWSGRDAIGWEATIDGTPFLVERGKDGDHRFSHGERSVQHLSADGGLLRCAWAEEDGAERWRIVLDSVLFSVALARGYEALHAGAVATERGAIAITAGAGGGKSTLLDELLRRGEALLSDDVVVLEARGDSSPLAQPGPPVMTVPTRVEPPPGEPIAALDDERWVAVPVAPEPLPLAGLIVLDRRAGLVAGMDSVDDPLPVLLGSLLRFPRTAERERARFEMAAAIASHVPVWRLRADVEVTPGELVDLLGERMIA
jgi:hypothetical protein